MEKELRATNTDFKMVGFEGIIKVDSLGRLGRGLVETAKTKCLPSSVWWWETAYLRHGSGSMSYCRPQVWALTQGWAFWVHNSYHNSCEPVKTLFLAGNVGLECGFSVTGEWIAHSYFWGKLDLLLIGRGPPALFRAAFALDCLWLNGISTAQEAQ